MDDLKMQKQTLKKAYKKTKRKHITPWKILAIICAVVMIVSIPLSILLQKFDNTMAARFGGSFWKLQNEDANAQYYTSDFNSAEEMVNYGLALTQQVEAEGAALLMNYYIALPLAADAKVSTFSSSSVNLVYGGTGSGNIDASTADTLRTALEKVGVTVNPTLWDFYTVGVGKDYARSKSGTVAKSSEVTAEVPWDVYTDEVKDSVAQYGDAAIVTLSRVGGEGADLSYGEVNYLALDENEKAMLQNVAEMKKEEAWEAQEDARTGNTVLTPPHASSVQGIYPRLATLCMQKHSTPYPTLISFVTEAFPLAVFLKKLDDGKRHIMEIAECLGCDEKGKVFTKTLWKYRVDSERIVDGKTVIDGRFVRVNPISKELRERMHENGVPNDVLDRFSEVR